MAKGKNFNALLEQGIAEGKEVQKNKLQENVELINKLALDYTNLKANAKLKWEGTEKFNKIIEILGDTPPIKLLEDVVTYYKNKAANIERKQLVDILQELRMSDLRLENGTQIKLQQFLEISKPEIGEDVDEEKVQQNIMKWFEKNGYSDAITTTLTFPKGSDTAALYDFLKKEKLSFDKKIGIHYQTQKKLLKLRYEEHMKALESGNKKEIKATEMPPNNILIVNVGQIANVKLGVL
jgi:hypothetical protein